MNSIISACFIGFDTLKITSSAALSGASIALSADNAVERVFPCATGRCTAVINVGEIDVCATYTAVIVCKNGERSSAVVVRKDRLYDTAEFNARYGYDGKLGLTYSTKRSEFAVWSPFAKEVALCVYDSGLVSATAHKVYKMTRSERGVWTATVDGNLGGKFYTFSVEADGTVYEVVDPYAVSAGRNGVRGAILDLASTDPKGFRTHEKPQALPLSRFVIYEAHLRDLTIAAKSVKPAHRGKYLGLTAKGKRGEPTPLEHIKNLGVTAVHFQPMFDFASVDESFKTATRNRDGEFNWGYDPQNYNMPEGSYSTNPDDPACRVRELKQMIMALHKEGIRVILDVVYNHVFDAETSNFQALCKNYYFRTDEDGALLNGSGCGNETASERYMFRRFMVDSVCHWAREYMVDGFRFDLMALHDVDTMNAVCAALKSVNPAIVVYGEGWDAGSNGLPENMRANKSNAFKIKDVAFFDDIVRDGLRGSVFDIEDNGFVSGKRNADGAVLVAAAGATDIVDEATYKTLGADKKAFAADPSQNINYVAVHDNSTLWDKLNASVNADEKTLKAMNRLAATAVMTGQGASLILAGEEMLRSKPTKKRNAYDNHPKPYLTREGYTFADNSYRSPDSVNEIDWSLAHTNKDMVDFYSHLIKIKTSFPQFGIGDRETLEKCLRFGRHGDGVAAFAVREPDGSEFAFVIINAGECAKTVDLPLGDYSVYVSGDKATSDRSRPIMKLSGSGYLLLPRSAAVMTSVIDDANVEKWSDSCNAQNKKIETSFELDSDIPAIVGIVNDAKSGKDIFN